MTTINYQFSILYVTNKLSNQIKNMLKSLSLASLLLLITIMPVLSQTATVTRIIDGDTIVTDGNTKVRLACIDAPESSQNSGDLAKKRLSELIPPGAKIQIVGAKKDRYGRTIAAIFNGQKFVNLQMVSEGHAVVYRQYLNACPNSKSDFLKAEEQAKKQRLNFWNQSNPCLPENYRKKKCNN
jgi:micrococcal nuclease